MPIGEVPEPCGLAMTAGTQDSSFSRIVKAGEAERRPAKIPPDSMGFPKRVDLGVRSGRARMPGLSFVPPHPAAVGGEVVRKIQVGGNHVLVLTE